jgi:signal transduction histidine kinase
MVRLGTALGGGGDKTAFVDEVLSVAIATTGAQRAVLIRGTPESHKVDRVLLASGARSDTCANDISWAVVSQVLTSGISSVFGDALTSEELASHRSIAVLKLRSLACIPLRAGSRVLGALYLDHHGIAGLISGDMLGFLELLAGVIALTLHVDNVEAQAGTVRRELTAAHRHIMRAERSRLAGELAGGLVHDLKNVLAAVSGRAQLLRRANHDPQVLRSLDAIEKAAGAGAGLVQRLQECARDHSSQREEPVDLATVAREALELLGPRLEKCRIATEMRSAVDAVVWGVPGEYREMFLNLFVNACDAMPDGGTLTVQFASGRDATSIEVAVADTGGGMSAETKARLFEPFYTTKGNNGTGLGLVVVRSVVVRRGGAIGIESSPGAGSTFVLTFPRTVK